MDSIFESALTYMDAPTLRIAEAILSTAQPLSLVTMGDEGAGGVAFVPRQMDDSTAWGAIGAALIEHATVTPISAEMQAEMLDAVREQLAHPVPVGGYDEDEDYEEDDDL